MPTAPAPSPLSTGTRAVFTSLRGPSQRSRHLPRCSTNRWVSSIRKERESGTATHLTRLDSRRRAASDGFENPHLRLTLGVLHFKVDPGMRDDQVYFLDHALDGCICVAVVAGRMVRRCRKSERERT